MKMELAKLEQEYMDIEAEQLNEIKNLDLAPYHAINFEELPKPKYSSENDGKEPFIKPLNKPYPQGCFNEVRPEPLLVWNDFQERYELRDKRILSEKTKQTILSMNRRFPTKWNKYELSKSLGLSKETIEFIFWEDYMRKKYKIPYDMDSIKLLEAYCGTDDLIESKAYTMMAYSEVTGDPFFSSGKLQGSPLVIHEDEMEEHLYSWQKKKRFVPNVSKDQYEIIPNQGSGSGKIIENISKNKDLPWSTIIVDVDDDYVGSIHNKKMNVKVRECNGVMRWATLDEVNYAKEKEYPKGYTIYSRIIGYKSVNKRKVSKATPKRKFVKHPFMYKMSTNKYWDVWTQYRMVPKDPHARQKEPLFGFD